LRIGYLIEDDFVTGTVLDAEGGQLLVWACRQR
jgi:hypothetical protein